MTFGIRNKLLLIIMGIIAFVLVTHTYLQITIQREAYEQELAKRTELLQQILFQRAEYQGETLSRLAANDLTSYNLFSLQTRTEQSVDDTDDLVYAIIFDVNGKIFLHTAKPSLKNTIYRRVPAQTDQPNNHTTASFISRDMRQTDAGAVVEYVWPLNVGDSNWGYQVLGYSLANLSAQISASEKENETNIEALSFKTMFIALVILVLASVSISQLSKRLIQPILKLSQLAKELACGDFSKDGELKVNSKDEVDELSRNFADMALKLENSYSQLEEYSSSLEEKVARRTTELNSKNLELSKALKSLEESQQQLIHAEKMAALGQLIAGVAHEVNTPLGAIKASVENSNKHLTAFTQGLGDLLTDSPPEHHTLLITLLNASSKQLLLSTREERQARRAVSVRLDEQNIAHSSELATMLVEMEVHTKLDQLLPALKQAESFNIVCLAHHYTAIDRNNETIRTAISRAAKMVFALKNFTHRDNSGSKLLSNINQGIKTVLVLYQNQVKQGFEVIEDFTDIPEIYCYPDELNQVWTNLIHNALHAMSTHGTLTIKTRASEQDIFVSITDTGSGIPAEIQDRIFDRLFTTKSAGEGTGLGLGISQQIIQGHNGELTFESEPGNTTFTVRLPIRQEI